METKAYPSKMSMLQDLEQRVEGLDLNTSAFLPRFSFATLEGKTFNCPNAMSFVKNVNKTFGDLLALDGTRTVSGRGKCILTFLDKDSTEEITKDNVKKEIVPETSSKDNEEVKLDLEYATSLQEGKSKKEAKDALESYGREFEVELNKQKSFENMLKDLQEALS